jgi:hypothetical protein
MRVECAAPTPTPAPFRAAPARAASSQPPRDSYAGSTREPDPVPAPLATRQLADSCGRVTHLALMLSSYVEGEARDQVLTAYKTLFTEMEPDTKFTVIVEDERDRRDVEALISANRIPNPERIHFLQPDVGGLTVWARDMMVGEYLPDDPSRTALLHQSTLHSWHDNDARVPLAITQDDPTIVLDAEPRLVTDGGDVQSNTRESFVGYYSIAATEEQLARQMAANPRFKQSLVDFYEKRFGKKVVDDKGPLRLPFHFVPQDGGDAHRHPFRLVPDRAARTASPDPARVTLEQATEDVAVALFADHFGKPVCVMGKDDPATPHVEEPATDHMDMGLTPIDDDTFLVGDPGLAQRLLGKRPASARNRDNQEDFDAYARTLEARGYKVLRVPHAEPDDSPSGAYVSYNNCLMERFEKDGKEIRRVFLPVYGIPELDDYAMEVWKSQGYEVHPIPLDALSERWGALRCISNWLDRSPRG